MPKDDWNMMSAQERAESARKMEVYAAMVEFIDENIKER
jgi:arylsulfatase